MFNSYAWSLFLLCAGLMMLCGCPKNNGTASGASGSSKANQVEKTTEPGMDFHRKNVGMPVTTLDFIGDSPVGLAGARNTGQVFFAVLGESEPELYMRDPVTMERRFLGQVPDMQQGSLAASADGKYVVYCRQRDLERYIDDPKTTYPKEIAVVTRVNVETGNEDVLFDFRNEPFKTYRNNVLTPSISRDGQFCAVVSYNMERLIKARMLSDWLAIEADLRDRGEQMLEEERIKVIEQLRQLLVSPSVKQYLEETGVEVNNEGAPVEEERASIKQYYNEERGLEPALLLWENGESRLLNIELPEDSKDSLLFIVGVSKEKVLVWLQNTIPDPLEPQVIYNVDLETGKLEEACSFLGTPSTYELSDDDSDLVVVYNPTDTVKKEILTETIVARFPLDMSESVEYSLEGDYLGLLDIVQDGRYVFGQDIDTHELTLCDIQNQSKHVQLRLSNSIIGTFLNQTATHAIFLDTGVLYSIPLSMTPQDSEGYISEEYFEGYKEKFCDFLSNLGFDIPEELEIQYEERWGLKTHEVSVQMHVPSQLRKIALMRYSVEDDQVVALWFPQDYLSTNSLMPLDSTPLDYYEIKERSEVILDKLDWMNSETRNIYQPGPNPLYDGRTGSYILLYRDGYWLDEDVKDKWIVNSEATIRIIADTGKIAELSISKTDPITDQTFSLSIEQALFSIRNLGEMPIPEDAPIRFDTDNVRYVIDMAEDKYYGPAEYSLGKRQRICYEIDAYITPEEELIATYRVDTETGEILGQLDFQPSSMRGLNPMGMY